MKLKRYLKLIEQHPFLATLLWELCAAHANPTGQELKTYLTERVKFVAYRPWQSLDLNAGNNVEERGTVPHAYAHQVFWSGVSYRIYFWVGNERGPRSRSISYPSEGIGETTVQAAINEVREWFREHMESPTVKLRWEAVIKSTSEGGVTISPRQFEIYEFPPDFQ